jgi:hypothetical protein
MPKKLYADHFESIIISVLYLVPSSLARCSEFADKWDKCNKVAKSLGREDSALTTILVEIRPVMTSLLLITGNAESPKINWGWLDSCQQWSEM